MKRAAGKVVVGALFDRFNRSRVRNLEILERRELLTVADLIADINPGTESSLFDFAEFHIFEDELYFAANDGQRGRELWKTDGTEGGTELVHDIFNGGTNSSSRPGGFAAFGNELYFAASDGSGRELWKSDGTTGGTRRVADISPGEASSTPQDITEFDGRLFFAASGSEGEELWTSDGTTGGTRELRDIREGSSGSNPAEDTGFVEFNGELYFDAEGAGQGVELWRSDGTAAGTELVIDSNPGFVGGWPKNLFEFRGDLYFTAETFSDDDALAHFYRVDGETGETTRAFDVPTEWRQPVLVQDDAFYFSGFEAATGLELYRSDGTPEGTIRLSDAMRGVNGSRPRNLTAVDGDVYFAAATDLNSEQGRVYRLWVTDGTQLGTRQVSSEEVYPDSQMLSYNGEVYYTGLSAEFGWELFRTDGVSVGSVVQDINPGENNSFALPKIVFDDKLLFLADNLTSGWEIWAWDGTEATMVDVHFGAGDITENPDFFTFFPYGNDLVFIGSTPFEGREPFIIRGPEPVELLDGDANEDGEVNVADFLILSRNFGSQTADRSMGDFDGDGSVSVSDFLILSRNFGASREAAVIESRSIERAETSGTTTAAAATDAAIVQLAEDDEREEAIFAE